MMASLKKVSWNPTKGPLPEIAPLSCFLFTAKIDLRRRCRVRGENEFSWSTGYLIN